jgi:uncharacterized cupredoxin-like copper-binding protein
MVKLSPFLAAPVTMTDRGDAEQGRRTPPNYPAHAGRSALGAAPPVGDPRYMTKTASHLASDESARVGGSLVRVAAFVVVVGLTLVGCAQVMDAHHAVSVPTGASRVDVTLSDYRIAVAPAPLAHGRIAFVVHNAASIPHELVVFRTDVPANRVPLGADGDANEDAKVLTNVVDSGASLTANQTKVFVANLAPGHYVAMCNLAGHYRLGMRLDLTVS